MKKKDLNNLEIFEDLGEEKGIPRVSSPYQFTVMVENIGFVARIVLACNPQSAIWYLCNLGKFIKLIIQFILMRNGV